MEVVVKSPPRRPGAEFWRGKRVLVTGHSGFKGSWLALWLQRRGAEVAGLALPPATTPSLFDVARVAAGMTSHLGDIRDPAVVGGVVAAFRPEIVFHLAAQPLVLAGYRDPLLTFSSNVMGTAHVLEALRDIDCVRVAVMITTDKVYRNNEWAYPYREDDPLGGHDPYSASKAASELVIASYRDAYLAERGVAVASARAGNVVGGGDWSEDRLIPDAVRAWQSGAVLEIRRPESIRPWQHVLEPLSGYLALAEALWERPSLAGAFNFGPHSHEAATVRRVIDLARAAYGRGETHFGDGLEGAHEAGWLALEISRARVALDVEPRWTLQRTIERTMAWYLAQAGGASAHALCDSQIAEFEAS